MASWPQIDTSRLLTIGANAAASAGTTVTAGSANTKGAWVQLVASTAWDVDELIVQLGKNSAAADYLVDLAVGAASSEVVIVSDLTVSAGSASVIRTNYPSIPIGIPAGSRLAARCQATTGSATLTVLLTLIQYGLNRSTSLARVTTYGANTADSGGTSVDPGATLNTKGAWVELTSSTSAAHQGLLIGIGNQVNTARTTCSYLVDLGVGGAGSEVVVVPNVILKASSGGDCITPCLSSYLPLAVPSGTRLAVRAASDTVDATDRLFDAVLYGIG